MEPDDYIFIIKTFTPLSSFRGMALFAFHVSFLVALSNRFPLIVFSFSLSQSQGHFRLSRFEVNLKRNQGLAFLFDLAGQSLDFVLVQEELSRTDGVVIPVGGKRVGAYMHVIQKDFTASDIGMAVLEVGPSKSQ